MYQQVALTRIAPADHLHTPPTASAAPREPFNASPPIASTSTAPKRAASPLESPSSKKKASAPPAQPTPTRRGFIAKDLLTPDWSLEQVEGWMQEHPALKKRDFFVLQRHHPAAHPKHFDLRLQLDNQLVTFCIPSQDGLSRAPKKGQGDDFQWGRLALEEQPRAVNITLLDGGGMGVTMCEDIGEYWPRMSRRDDRRARPEVGTWTCVALLALSPYHPHLVSGCPPVGEHLSPLQYRVLPRMSDLEKRKRAKKAIRKQGFSDDTTTDEEESDEESEEAEDEKQETLFAEAFYHASFLPLPPRWVSLVTRPPRTPAIVVVSSSSCMDIVIAVCAFTFNAGRRFARMHNKSGPPDIPRYFQHQWYFNLDSRSGSSGIIFPSYKQSLLTDRTMEEIAADKENSTTTAEDWYTWNAPLARKWEAGVKGRRP
ncbi:hypothetical protein BCR35DRAFT_332435 [Leucosporidium creatinivorum]|uniref:Uncharacterized protein n=1 Tax=Leucosporidium creatinivorum TaxID=106004 RepID=A0A1Y2F406_9BASI|nr:hypothetical protein BCR35DRAFT_332435 [Leucosporidium creatinivorum]